jgi:hypothetical protein
MKTFILFQKNTTKMVYVKKDVIDNKIDSEIIFWLFKNVKGTATDISKSLGKDRGFISKKFNSDLKDYVVLVDDESKQYNEKEYTIKLQKIFFEYQKDVIKIFDSIIERIECLVKDGNCKNPNKLLIQGFPDYNYKKLKLIKKEIDNFSIDAPSTEFLIKMFNITSVFHFTNKSDVPTLRKSFELVSELAEFNLYISEKELSSEVIPSLKRFFKISNILYKMNFVILFDVDTFFASIRDD